MLMVLPTAIPFFILKSDTLPMSLAIKQCTLLSVSASDRLFLSCKNCAEVCEDASIEIFSKFVSYLYHLRQYTTIRHMLFIDNLSIDFDHALKN